MTGNLNNCAVPWHSSTWSTLPQCERHSNDAKEHKVGTNICHNVMITRIVETCLLFSCWSGFWRGWWPVLGLWLRLWLVLLLTLCSEGFLSSSKSLLEWAQIDFNQTFLAAVLWSTLEKAAGHNNQILANQGRGFESLLHLLIDSMSSCS